MDDVIEKQGEQDVAGLVKEKVRGKYEMVAVSPENHAMLKSLKVVMGVRSVDAVISKLLDVKGVDSDASISVN